MDSLMVSNLTEGTILLVPLAVVGFVSVDGFAVVDQIMGTAMVSHRMIMITTDVKGSYSSDK